MLTFAFSNPPAYDLLDDVSVCIAFPGAPLPRARRPATPASRALTACANSLVAGQTAGAHFVYTGTCDASGDTTIPCCYADYNKVNGVSVQDIFDFLNDWFAGSHFAFASAATAAQDPYPCRTSSTSSPPGSAAAAKPSTPVNPKRTRFPTSPRTCGGFSFAA